MKVIGASIEVPKAAVNRPRLTPELMASVAARYSRSNDGLDQILSKIDLNDPEKSIESIMRFVDYGHQSIGDMVPVAMFIDGISEILAYLVWTATPVQTAAGQESSTRYIKLSIDGLIDPDVLGIAKSEQEAWHERNCSAFEAYESALRVWGQLLDGDPGLAKIPSNILEDTDKTLQVSRMKKNYAFDRARVYLPVGVATNMFLLMSARSWAGLCRYLLSTMLPEATSLGEAIVKELELYAPHLTKHASFRENTAEGILEEFTGYRALSGKANGDVGLDANPIPSLDVLLPSGVTGQDLADSLRFHENRYDWIGQPLRRTAVRFGWQAVGLAEIRDFNRHRTGNKYCPIVPVGFHTAIDQCPAKYRTKRAQLKELSPAGMNATRRASQLLRDGDPTYVYSLLLGTQLPFEHLTTGDKFVYEMELRTGTGAHYRYAGHCHDLLKIWFERFPEMRGKIIEGTAEPE